jgi:hypothetical protein
MSKTGNGIAANNNAPRNGRGKSANKRRGGGRMKNVGGVKRKSVGTAGNHHNRRSRMNLKFLIPTIRSACQHAIISQELNTSGPRAGLVLSFDANNNPHMLYVEDAANSRRPSHIVSGELLQIEVKNLADTIATLNLSLDQAVDRMTFVLLPSLASFLYSNKSTDERMAELANILNNYAMDGIATAIASPPPPPKPAMTHNAERN